MSQNWRPPPINTTFPPNYPYNYPPQNHYAQVSAQSHVYQRFNGSWQPPPANQHPAYPGWNYSTYYNQQTYHQHNPYVQPCTNVMNPYTNYNSNTQQQQLNTATSSSVQNDHNGSVHNFEGTSNVQSKNIIDIPLDDKMHQLSNPSLPLKQTKRNSLETPSPYSEPSKNELKRRSSESMQPTETISSCKKPLKRELKRRSSESRQPTNTISSCKKQNKAKRSKENKKSSKCKKDRAAAEKLQKEIQELNAQLLQMQSKTKERIQTKKELYLVQKDKIRKINIKINDIDNMRFYIEKHGYAKFIAKYTHLRSLTDKSTIIDWIDNEELSLQIELSKAERKCEKIKADKNQLEDEILQHNKGSTRVEVISDSDDEVVLVDNASNKIKQSLKKVPENKAHKENGYKQKLVLRKCFHFGDCMTGEPHTIKEEYVDEGMYAE